eukprot:CAMPEP_0197522766 /NCGR_PEP_ID=MMETSP1318-20131121/7849_1 /TAXON_ID=552666 /ORGANISM="Partenskyella glossopodia, Strain RCC365" /LENGTH=433 /DNA_ID=CAMNT_0043075243 /DNA_START=14 /DNA_END=1315 /DNA_ORIENTATION=+
MARFRGNHNFQSRVEFMEMARALFPNWIYLAIFTLFLFNITTSNVSAILESAQTLDNSLLMVFGKVCALELTPDPGVICVEKIKKSMQDSDSVFGEDICYVSFGYVALALISIPVGLWNLEENMTIQIASCAALCIILLQFCLQFFNNGLHPEYVPISKLGAGAGVSLGSILFNFAFVVTVPSWVNEKRRDVSIRKTLSYSMVTGALMFAAMGLVGSMAYKFPHGADLLAKLSYPNQWMLTRVLAQLFPPLVLVPGIPILSIVVRYNLLENRCCGPLVANLVSVALPWLVALISMSGNNLNVILNWSGLLTVAPLNFLIPCAMYLKSGECTTAKKQVRRMDDYTGENKEEEVGVSMRSVRRVYTIESEGTNKKVDSQGETVEPSWRLLPFMSERMSEAVAWIVISVIATLNVSAILLAIRGLLIHDGILLPSA